MAQTLYINVKGDTKDLVQDLKKAENVTVTSGKKMTKSLGAVDKAYQTLKTAVVAYLGVQTVKAVIDIADSYSLLESRLKLVTSGTKELKEVQSALLSISNESRVSYEATANLYARLGRSTEQLGTSTEDLLKVTDTISKALIVSGASATEAENALIQLSQGLASGALRGDELRSVLEQVPRVAKAIADGMGITVGQLREFGAAGKLTAEAVIPALISQLDKINEEFAQIDVTVSQATTVLKNAFFDIINDASKASGMTKDLSAAILDLAKSITDNKEPIIAVFSGIVNAIGAVINTFGALSNTIEGFMAVGFGEMSFFELMNSDAQELKQTLLDIGNENSARNNLKRLSEEQEHLTDKLKEDRAAQKLFGDDSKRISKEVKKLYLDRIHVIKVEKKAIEAVADILKNEYVDGWRTANKVVVQEGSKAIESIEKKNDALFKSVVRESQKTTKIRKDNWQIQLKDRVKVIDRMEKAQGQATKNELKVSEKAHANEMKLNATLAQSIDDGWLQQEEGAKDAYERLEKHGEDYFHVSQGVWEDLGITTEKFFDDLEEDGRSTVEDMKGIFSGWAADLMSGEFSSIGDAWNSLWTGMLKTVVDTVAEMAAKFVVDSIVTAFFHDGAWDVGDRLGPGEHPAVVEEGEMIIPGKESDEIRGIVGGKKSFRGLIEVLRNGSEGVAVDDRGAFDMTSSGGLTSPATRTSGPERVGSLVGGIVGRGTAKASPFGAAPGVGSIGAFVGRAIGGWVGDRLGDLTDSRGYEGVRDAFEDGRISGYEAHTFEQEAKNVGIGPKDTFAGILDAYDDMENKVKSTVLGVLDTLGAGDDAEAFTRAEGTGGQMGGADFGDRESERGGMGGVHGGMDFIPKETTYMLDKGERVLSPRQNRDLTDYLQMAKKGAENLNVTIMLNGRQLNKFIEDVIVERNNSTIAPTGRLYGY